MESMDISAVRDAFPALHQDQVYLDNAGGSQVLGSVIESIKKYLSTNNVQLGGSYRLSQVSTNGVNEGGAAAAKYINAAEEEIVLGPSTTQLFRNLSYALQLQEGDELIVSQIDHEANIAPWVDIAKRQKLSLKWWAPKDSTNPKLLASDLEGLMTSKTKLVTCTHASNILGTIHDIRAIARQVHTVPGAMLCVDAVAYAPHRHIDVKALEVDFYCFSWYKVYGPHIAMLYASSTAMKQLGSLGHYFNPHETLSQKLGLAAGSYEMVQAIPQVTEYLGRKGFWEESMAHEAELQAIVLEYLSGRKDVTIRGEKSSDPSLRVSTVSFTIDGWSSREFVEAVEKQSEYAFRWGAFYSNRLVCETFGLNGDGVIRVSMVHYNTAEEVRGLLGVFDKVLN